jgi:hypothetical protein
VGTATVTAAGCGRTKHAASPIAPQQVESTFSRRGIQLIDTMLYTNSDRPIIRSYDVPGQGTKMSGVVFVYDSADDAAKTEPTYRKVYGSRSLVVRDNVIAQFSRDTTMADRRQITNAMAALR